MVAANTNHRHRTNKTDLIHPDWIIECSNLTAVHFEGYQAITFKLTFKREWTSHLIHFFAPSIILSISSMMSLYIHYDMLPARMSLSVTTCLAMITLIMGAK